MEKDEIRCLTDLLNFSINKRSDAIIPYIITFRMKKTENGKEIRNVKMDV
jgi:hypothetical protein